MKASLTLPGAYPKNEVFHFVLDLSIPSLFAPFSNTVYDLCASTDHGKM